MRAKVLDLHIPDQPKIPGPGCLEDWSQITINHPGIKRNRHTLEFHLQLWVLGCGKNPLYVLPTVSLDLVQCGRQTQSLSQIQHTKSDSFR